MATAISPNGTRAPETIGKNQTFRQLLQATSVSMLGSHVSAIAYPLLVLRLTGSPFAAGCVTFAAAAPGIIAPIPAGALIDRWNPKWTMLISELGRGLALVTIAVTVALGKATVVQLITTAFIEGALEVFSELAERRYVGLLVERAEVRSALVHTEARTHLVLVAGRPLGSLLFELSPMAPFIADAISFACSVSIIRKLKEAKELSRGKTSKPAQKTRLMDDMREGIHQINKDMFARMTILCFSIGTFIFQALIMVFLGDASGHGLPPYLIGMVLAASGIGGAMGSSVARRLLPKDSRRWVRIQMLIWFGGFALLLLSAGRQFLLVAAVMAVLGFTGAMGNIALDTYLIHSVGEKMLARVMGVSRLATFSACATGTILGGLLIQEFSVSFAALCLFLCTLVLLLLAALMPRPVSRHQKRRQEKRKQQTKRYPRKPTRTPAGAQHGPHRGHAALGPSPGRVGRQVGPRDAAGIRRDLGRGAHGPHVNNVVRSR